MRDVDLPDNDQKNIKDYFFGGDRNAFVFYDIPFKKKFMFLPMCHTPLSLFSLLQE